MTHDPFYKVNGVSTQTPFQYYNWDSGDGQFRWLYKETAVSGGAIRFELVYFDKGQAQDKSIVTLTPATPTEASIMTSS